MTLINSVIVVVSTVALIGIVRLATSNRYKNNAPEWLKISLATACSILVFAFFPLFVSRLFNLTNSVGAVNYYAAFIAMIASAIQLPLGIIMFFMLVAWSKRSLIVGSIIYALMNVIVILAALLAIHLKSTTQLIVAVVNCALGAILFFTIIAKGKQPKEETTEID